MSVDLRSAGERPDGVRLLIEGSLIVKAALPLLRSQECINHHFRSAKATLISFGIAQRAAPHPRASRSCVCTRPVAAIPHFNFAVAGFPSP